MKNQIFYKIEHFLDTIIPHKEKPLDHALHALCTFSHQSPLFSKMSRVSLQKKAYELYSQSFFVEAKQFYQFLVFLNPTHFSYWLFLSNCQLYTGAIKEAIKSVNMAMVLRPEEKTPYLMAALLYAQSHLEEELRKCAKQCRLLCNEKTAYLEIEKLFKL